MLDATELLKVHLALWSDPVPSSIEIKGQRYMIDVVENERASFRQVRLPDRKIITQNMVKPSPNTSWVNNNPGSMLTWIIKDRGGYHAKISTVRDSKGMTTTFSLLKPTEHEHSQIRTRL